MNTPKLAGISKSDPLQIVANLEPHTLYEVEVAFDEHNVIHQSFLFFGHTRGASTYVYNNTYEYPYRVNEVYYLKVVRPISTIKDFFDEKETVDWRFEYNRDNIFNVVMPIFILVSMLFDEQAFKFFLTVCCLIMVCINVSAMRYFQDEKTFHKY